MHKRQPINLRLRVPTVSTTKQTTTSTAPMTPHQPPVFSAFRFSPARDSAASAYLLSPVASSSVSLNPFMSAARSGSRNPALAPREGDGCVQDSRNSAQFQQTKRLPNTLTAKLGGKAKKKPVTNSDAKTKPTTTKRPTKLAAQDNASYMRYSSCGSGCTPVVVSHKKLAIRLEHGGGKKPTSRNARSCPKAPTVCLPPRRPARCCLPCLKLSCVSAALARFLGCKDYLAYLMCSRQVYSRKLVNKKTEMAILSGGMDAKTRQRYWIAHCKVAEMLKRAEHGFSYFVAQECPQAGDIGKDLDRTFSQRHRFYSRPENTKRLGRVLRAFAAKNRDIGYIQGLNFIAGHLLLQFSDELSFWLLDALVQNYGLREFLRESMPRLKLTLYQMERLMQIHVPDIYSALISKEITCELFCVQWFVTLFSYDFDFPALYTIWDLFLLHKWKFVFQMSIAVLQQMEEKIEKLDYEHLIHYMKNAIRDRLFSHSETIKLALQVQITNRELRLLKGEYERKTNNVSVIKEEADSGASSLRALPSPPREEAAAGLPLQSRVHLRPQSGPVNAGFVHPVVLQDPAADSETSAIYTRIKEEYLAHQENKGPSRSTTEGLLRADGSSKESCNISSSTLNSPGVWANPIQVAEKQKRYRQVNVTLYKRPGAKKKSPADSVAQTEGKHASTLAGTGKRGRRDVLGKLILN